MVAIVGAALGGASLLTTLQQRRGRNAAPARIAISGETSLGDSLPRSRPTFAAWTNLSILGVAFVFALLSVLLAFVLERLGDAPALSVVIASALTLCIGVPITVVAAIWPGMR
ncbi:hypothetical protein AU196_06160 [Mycobacterium sp. IS-1742]|uniref:hypothetical protein n=1 Tax=Mycobacterium sp. IS-1742 TaxID=1772285 RepID=UPI00074018F4|nr:hypothetical protein [Mycobacterium sp. IS-1742]KUI30180.1 hypothetical protein AU196_06160 [Mycobacterium sp. IS-1742]